MKQVTCMTCGTTGLGKTHTPGSIIIELFLWLCFLIPGALYSIWRLTARCRVCHCCGSDAIVPANSPLARKMQEPGK